MNRARTLQTADTPLSDLGRRQAQALAERLRSDSIDALVASDMARASQTAQIVSQTLGLPVVQSALLRERNFGLWCGQTYEQVGFDPFDESRDPPAGESAAQFRARVAQALAWVMTQRSGCTGPLAVISHGLVIREFVRLASVEPDVQRRFGGLSAGQLASHPALANTAVSIFSATMPLRLSLFACDAHLSSLGPSADPGPGAPAVA